MSALLAFNESYVHAKNIEVMTHAIDQVKSIEVTFAVKDTFLNGIRIAKGDIIGFADGKLVKRGSNPDDIVLEMLSDLVDVKTEVITLIAGEQIENNQAELLCEKIQASNYGVEVELYFGKQMLYYYIVAVE